MAKPQKKPAKRTPVESPRKGSILLKFFLGIFLVALGLAGYLSWDYYKQTGELPGKDKERTVAYLKEKAGMARERIDEGRELLNEGREMLAKQLEVSKERLQEQSTDIEKWFEEQKSKKWIDKEDIKPAETWDDMMKVASAYLPDKKKEEPKKRTARERMDPEAAAKMAEERRRQEAEYEAKRQARLASIEDEHERRAEERRMKAEEEAAAKRRAQEEQEAAERAAREPKPDPIETAELERPAIPEEAPAPADPPPPITASKPKPAPEPEKAASVEVEEMEVKTPEPVAAAEPEQDDIGQCKQWLREGSGHIRNAYSLRAGPKKQREILAARELFVRARDKLGRLQEKQPNNGEIDKMLVDCNSGIWFCNKNITL